MLAVVSLLSVAAGAAAAYLAERLSKHARAIETCAGFLLIGGFALIGVLLPAAL